MNRFAGCRVAIVGGTSGIGLAIARKFKDAGAEVVLGSRSAERVASARIALGGDVAAYTVDGGDEASVKRFFSSAGAIDHLVVSAGSSGMPSLFLETDERTFRNAFENKFWIYVNCARVGVPAIRGSGSLTFVTGILGMKAERRMSCRIAVNAALNALVGPMAVEMAPVRVNAVAPGLIDSVRWNTLSKEERERFYGSLVPRFPIPRPGSVEEVGDAVLYLAGSEYSTGVVLPVDGGFRHV